MARLAVAGVLALLALPAPAAAAVQQPRTHYGTAIGGTNAFIGVVKKLNCFKAYLSDGTQNGATLSVWLRGCPGPDGHASATRGGVSFDARLTRRRAVGTVTLRDGRALAFSATAGDGGGVVGRRFMHQGRRYRSGFVVLRGNAVRWAITPVGRGLYGDSAPSAWDDCGNVAAERELLRAQRGPLLTQSGVWESRTNANRGPTSADYNRLNQAIGALDESIFALDQRVYDCP